MTSSKQEHSANIRNSGNEKQHRLGIGELLVCSDECATLHTLVGSCVGLILYDPIMRIGGMAHIVHPASEGKKDQPGKYADTAIHNLIDGIVKLGGRKNSIIAKYAGGAKMLNAFNNNAIGDLNVAMIEHLLGSLKIPIKAKECGGKCGRRLTLAVATGHVTVQSIGSPSIEL